MNIYGINRSKLENILIDSGFKKFNATQIFEWLYDKNVTSFNDMSNLSKNLISFLNNNFNMEKLSIVKCQKEDDVSKYLFKLKDDNYIEAVLMKHNYGNSLCISSQVGCNMGCTFCESGRLKKIRNLDTYEMVLQVMMVNELLDNKITSVVVMGIGEPFDNYENVMDFVFIINDDKALKIGARHITISTCGIIPKIKLFMECKLQVNLAISLHASNDELRNKLMPVNKVYPLKDLIITLKEYINKTNRRVTIEYILLKGINDSEEDAMELIRLLKGMNIYINLIPYNETENIQYKRSEKMQIMKFYDIINQNKINVTIRREYGNKIDGACGQLRAKGVE